MSNLVKFEVEQFGRAAIIVLSKNINSALKINAIIDVSDVLQKKHSVNFNC